MNSVAGSSSEPTDRFGLDEGEWAFLLDRLGRPPSDIEGAFFALLQGEEIAHRSSRSLLDSFIAEELRVPSPLGVRLGIIKIRPHLSVAVAAIDANRDLAIATAPAVQSAVSEVLLRLAAVRARPLGILPLFRAGPLDDVVNQKLLSAVALALAGHANTSGVPVLDTDIYFHPRYRGSPLLNMCAIGVVEGEVFTAVDAPPPLPGPKTILYLGGPTGRENLKKVDKKGRVIEVNGKSEKILRTSGAFLMRNLLDCIVKMEEQKYLTAAAACGFGGLAVAFRNLSLQLGAGFKVDLDRIPASIPELPPRDILFSEGSERMLIAFPSDYHRKILGLLRQYQIPNTILGETDDLESLRFDWNRRTVADIPPILLGLQQGRKNYQLVKFPPMLKQKKDPAEVVQKAKRRPAGQGEWGQIRDALEVGKKHSQATLKEPKNIEDSWVDLLADPNIVSTEPFNIGFFQDRGGVNTLPYPSAASVLRLCKSGSPAVESGEGIAATISSGSLYMAIDAYLGAVHAVADAVRNLAAAGAVPAGLAYNLNFGDPEDYREICDLSEAVRGIGDACKFWNIPVTTETISLFNGSEAVPILPTPSIYMVGTISGLFKSPGAAFKNKKDKIFIIGRTRLEIECSEYAWYLHHYAGSKLPDVNFEHEQKVTELVRGLVNSAVLASAAPIGRGGIAAALARSCMLRQPPIGATVSLVDTIGPEKSRRDGLLFSETPGRFLLSCRPEFEGKLIELCAAADVAITGLGEVGGKAIEVHDGVECQIPLSTAYRVWSTGLNFYLGIQNEEESAAG